jgi:hypothetical protein
MFPRPVGLLAEIHNGFKTAPVELRALHGSALAAEKHQWNLIAA